MVPRAAAAAWGLLVASLATGAHADGVKRWELLASQDILKENFPESARSTFLCNPDDPTADAFMVIGRYDRADPNLQESGKYHFKLVYGWKDTDYFAHDMTKQVLEWRQSSWLTEPTVEGFECVDPWDCGPSSQEPQVRFNGLAKSHEGAWSVLDGDGTRTIAWWNSIGSLQPVHRGIPAWNHQTAQTMQLFVASSSSDQRLSVPVCTDGIVLKMPDPSECPDNVQDLRPCDLVSEGEYCKSRGECGTDVRANNCPTMDHDGVRVWLPVYLKGLVPVTTTTLPPRTCKDGRRVELVPATDCPPELHSYDDLMPCEAVAPGNLCEGDGPADCGTDNSADNCVVKDPNGDFEHLRDIYRKEGEVTTQTQTTRTSTSTTPAPLHFSCVVGGDDVKGWTMLKQEWCCKHEKVACPTTSTTQTTSVTTSTTETTTLWFSCEVGVERMEVSWSDFKKDWCCHHKLVACPPGWIEAHSTTTKTKTITSTTSKTTTSTTMTFTTTPYSCQDPWAAWPEPQKVWCCGNMRQGCPTETVDRHFEDVDNDRLTLQLTPCGTLNYLVNGQMTLMYVTHVMVEGTTVHVEGTPIGDWDSKRYFQLSDDDVHESEHAVNLQRMSLQVAPVYEFESEDGKKAVHMLPANEGQEQRGIAFYALKKDVPGAQRVLTSDFFGFAASQRLQCETLMPLTELWAEAPESAAKYYVFPTVYLLTTSTVTETKTTTSTVTTTKTVTTTSTINALAEMFHAPRRKPMTTTTFVEAEAAEASEDDDRVLRCAEIGFSYSPDLTDAGEAPTVEDNMKACAERCSNVTQCAHFTFSTTDRWCRVSGATASKQDAARFFYSGSKDCHGKRLLQLFEVTQAGQMWASPRSWVVAMGSLAVVVALAGFVLQRKLRFAATPVPDALEDGLPLCGPSARSPVNARRHQLWM